MGEERLRIAREIHDVVAHAMTAINVQAGVAAHLLERDPGQAYDALRNIKRTSGDALTELRSTLEVLRDPVIGGAAGPARGPGRHRPAHRRACARPASTVTLDVDSAVDVPAPVQSVAYRIVQEALTNVARHAHASAATVSVRRGPGSGHDRGQRRRRRAGPSDHRRDRWATACGACASGPPPWAGHGNRRPAPAGDGGGWRVHAWLPMSPPASNGTAVTEAEAEAAHHAADGELRR